MIPEGITGAELDRSIKAELRSLPRTLADLVAQHLVASGRAVDSDPELAYQHAQTARRLAARLGGVREAVAITAYYTEHYDEALTEFRAVRRMTGNHEVLPSMADCERALGRPEKALALSRDKHVRDLSEGGRIEMLIVAAGARRDLGQTAAAIQTLEVPELTKRTRAEWLPRLRYAYADALAEAGRTDDALIWFHRAAGADTEGVTGAAERAAELEGLVFTDLADDEDDDESDQATNNTFPEDTPLDEPITDYHSTDSAQPAADTLTGDAALGEPFTEDSADDQSAGSDEPATEDPPLDDALDEAFTARQTDDTTSYGPQADGAQTSENPLAEVPAVEVPAAEVPAVEESADLADHAPADDLTTDQPPTEEQSTNRD